MTAQVEPLVVRPRAAEIMLGVGHKTLYRLLNEGQLESYTEGRARKITVKSIRGYINKRLKTMATAA